MSTLLGFLNTALAVLFFFFAILGILDTLPLLKFAKRKDTDWTAFFVNWAFVKWDIAQAADLAERYPFVSQDLRETLGLRKDDGKIS